MSVTFGSVGDIIAVCLLVKDLVDALNQARGSKAEYQSLTHELWVLDRVLLEIDLFERNHRNGSTPELEALCETVRKTVDRSKELVTDFQKKISRYSNSFDDQSLKNPRSFKGACMAMRWRAIEKDTVEKFRVDVNAAASNLQMLLATASVTMVDLQRKDLKSQMETTEREHGIRLAQQDQTISSLDKRITETNRPIASNQTITEKIFDAVRLDWLRQLGTDLKAFMDRIMGRTEAIHDAVMQIHSVLPSHLERTLIEDPFILEDAIGRIAPVHLQFVTSWEALNAVLEIRFKGVQGLNKVRERQYILQEKHGRREIRQSRAWEGAFLPGQSISMSFLFDTAADQDDGLIQQPTTCPGCQTSSSHSSDTDIQCEACGMFFRRVTVVEEIEPPKQIPMPTPWKLKSEFGKTGFGDMAFGPVKPGTKRSASGEIVEEEDIRDFKRVRLVQRKKRIKMHQFGMEKGAQGFKSFSVLSSINSDQPITSLWASPDGKHLVAGSSTVEDKHETQEVDITEIAELMNQGLKKARADLLSAREVRHRLHPNPELALEAAVDEDMTDMTDIAEVDEVRPVDTSSPSLPASIPCEQRPSWYWRAGPRFEKRTFFRARSKQEDPLWDITYPCDECGRVFGDESPYLLHKHLHKTKLLKWEKLLHSLQPSHNGEMAFSVKDIGRKCDPREEEEEEEKEEE